MRLADLYCHEMGSTRWMPTRKKGGSTPASFADQNHIGLEFRGGLTSKYALSDRTSLLAHAEVAHRFNQAPIREIKTRREP